MRNAHLSERSTLGHDGHPSSSFSSMPMMTAVPGTSGITNGGRAVLSLVDAQVAHRLSSPNMHDMGSSGQHNTVAQWEPTRLTSPYRVLSAAGVQNDFYTSCLSWGRERMALALRDDLHLFYPRHPRQQSATAHLSGDAAQGSGAAPSRRPSAVAVSRFDDGRCFMGFSDGSVDVFECAPDGTLASSHKIDMPPSPVGELTALLNAPQAKPGSSSSGGGSNSSSSPTSAAVLAKATTALAACAATLSSVSCICTTNAHPWLAAACTSGSHVLTLDSRTPKPSTLFGQSAPSDAPLPGAADTSLQARIEKASRYIRQQDRLCSVVWNANGSLVATGGSNGIVKLWSPSVPHMPVQTIHIQQDATVKALAFHPTNPYELLVGAEAGTHGLRVYDVSTAHPILRWSASTTAQTTQALYAPDGSHLITSQAARIEHPVELQQPHQYQVDADEAGGSTTGLVRALHGEPLSEQWGPEPSVRADPVLASSMRESSMSPSEMSPGTQRRTVSSHALVVWKRGATHQRSHAMRELFLGRNEAHGGHTSSSDSREVPSLSMLYALVGHRSRPLYLASPFQQSPDAGCVASVAGGEDDTIRFWRAFRSHCAASLWDQRQKAQLETAATQEDVDRCLAVPLR